MTETFTHAYAYLGRPIAVQVECGERGLWYATSPDVRGLLVAEADREKLPAAIEMALRELEEVERP